jgi:hypothetical protein
MVQIRVVRVRVTHDCVHVDVRVRRVRRAPALVGMLVVLVMIVEMLVLTRFVDVLMLVSLGEMEPYAEQH